MNQTGLILARVAVGLAPPQPRPVTGMVEQAHPLVGTIRDVIEKP